MTAVTLCHRALNVVVANTFFSPSICFMWKLKFKWKFIKLLFDEKFHDLFQIYLAKCEY